MARAPSDGILGGSTGAGGSCGIRLIISKANAVFCTLSWTMLACCCVRGCCSATAMNWFNCILF